MGSRLARERITQQRLLLEQRTFLNIGELVSWLQQNIMIEETCPYRGKKAQECRPYPLRDAYQKYSTSPQGDRIEINFFCIENYDQGTTANFWVSNREEVTNRKVHLFNEQGWECYRIASVGVSSVCREMMPDSTSGQPEWDRTYLHYFTVTVVLQKTTDCRS